jgi:hypothetical protein
VGRDELDDTEFNLYLRSIAMTAHEIITTLGGIKPIFKAVAAVVTLVTGKFPFKYDDDLPTPILIVFAIAEIYALSFVPDAQREIAWAALVAGLLVSSIIFMLVYRFLSYTKTVDTFPPKWQFWRMRYSQSRIVGGYWLRPEARAAILRNGTTTQGYFAGVAFNEDMVWPRWSRALAWLTLVVTYFILILSSVGIAYLAALTWS